MSRFTVYDKAGNVCDESDAISTAKLADGYTVHDGLAGSAFPWTGYKNDDLGTFLIGEHFATMSEAINYATSPSREEFRHD